MIQDPEAAAFGGMRGLLALNTVDIVAPLERIGPLLGGALRVSSRPDAGKKAEVSEILTEEDIR